jgi:formylglycine-generating enzyme required for sulfatase activity
MSMTRPYVFLARAILLAACLPAVARGDEAAVAEPQAAAAGERMSLDLGGGLSMELVRIPAGKFLMGTAETEQDRQPNEGPQHEVTISKPFFMGVYPVTSEQFKQVTGGMQGARMIGGPKYPVVGMSWDVAVDFCKTLSEKIGRTVRLPTEAEREYACRAGTTTRFPYGDDPEYARIGDYAWYDKNCEHQPPKQSKPIWLHPPGEKKPNGWGLHDMLGNVYEWCSDFYAPQYQAGPATDPTGPPEGKAHVVRGNTHHFRRKNQAPNCRSAYRDRGNPDQGIGFRVVVE